MKYMMLIYETGADVASRTNENKETFWATVRSKDGKRQVEDGPYADTKEQLGGFMRRLCPALTRARWILPGGRSKDSFSSDPKG